MKVLRQGACSSPDTRAELCVSVPASPAAGLILRHAVRVLERYFGEGRTEEVELMVTELATNGVKHAAAEESNRITLDAKVEGERLHVSVSDRGSGFTPARRPLGRSEPGGWGLVLVAGLADRWGVERDPSTRVWFEVGRGAMAA